MNYCHRSQFTNTTKKYCASTKHKASAEVSTNMVQNTSKENTANPWWVLNTAVTTTAASAKATQVTARLTHYITQHIIQQGDEEEKQINPLHM